MVSEQDPWMRNSDRSLIMPKGERRRCWRDLGSVGTAAVEVVRGSS